MRKRHPNKWQEPAPLPKKRVNKRRTRARELERSLLVHVAGSLRAPQLGPRRWWLVRWQQYQGPRVSVPRSMRSTLGRWIGRT